MFIINLNQEVPGYIYTSFKPDMIYYYVVIFNILILTLKWLINIKTKKVF